jgi:hypothetical protein
MLKETITFTDFNDESRTITEYFNLSEAEIVEMQARSTNGIQADMEDAVKSNDVARVLDFITMLVHKSYGKKSEDGIHFRKSPEILQNFIDSAYYSDFLLGLIENDGAKGQEFVRGIMPKKLVERALAQAQGQANIPTVAPSAREVFEQSRSQENPLVQPFGQPEYPTVEATKSQVESPTVRPQTQDERDRAEYEAWKAQKAAREGEQAQQSAVGRPPHEQLG